MSQKLVQKRDEKIKLFLQSIKSDETRRLYIVCLNKWLEYMGTKKILLEVNPKKVEQKIIDFIISMKEKSKSFAAIHNYISAVIKFYTINDVVLNSNKIYRFMPEKKKSKRDRAYTHEEIHKMLDIADERMRTLILLLSSSGMRIGAIPDLRLRNLEKIQSEYGEEYKITVYEGFNEEYITFSTPECTVAIDSYLDMRSRYGEKLDGRSYLIREQFDIRDPFAISKCKKTVSNTLANKIIDLAVRSGIRVKEVLGEDEKHHGGRLKKDVPICHGFRKFYSSQMVEADVKTEYRWLMEGHQLKANDGSYVKPPDQKLYEQYQKAINNLTINEEFRLRKRVETLQIEKSQLQLIAQDIAMLKKRMKR